MLEPNFVTTESMEIQIKMFDALGRVSTEMTPRIAPWIFLSLQAFLLWKAWKVYRRNYSA